MGDASMADARARRSAPARKGAEAVARLAELRSKGAKRSRLQELEDEEDEPLYDVVEEDEYADLVAKRRETAGEALRLADRSFSAVEPAFQFSKVQARRSVLQGAAVQLFKPARASGSAC